MRERSSNREYRHQPRDPETRAGDRDRDASADILREQHLAGRLGSDEFEERLDRCYAAKTYGELDDLVADLPGKEPTRSARRTWHLPAVALLVLLVAVITLGRGHWLWLAIPLFFIGRPLLWRSEGRRCGWWGMCYGGQRSSSQGTYV